jgi:hypothetical protein
MIMPSGACFQESINGFHIDSRMFVNSRISFNQNFHTGGLFAVINQRAAILQHQDHSCQGYHPDGNQPPVEAADAERGCPATVRAKSARLSRKDNIFGTAQSVGQDRQQ